ncbi:hypothetical protein RI845_15790 [Thalassotalea nanhaiensis]|uniref:Uncharacterized protein n=1 Tax=Thalassotalea nanhaiensis TaxID=3065648 RepID=A0ABY9TH73_9GAMM|nr:hypothetical protein RI845_15790 [Colwelliaceae bacterium SQ345]
MYNYQIFALSIFIISPTINAKPDCSPLLDDLKKVQSKLRSGYSVKQGEKLKTKEKKMKELWWQCRNNKLSKTEKVKLNKRLKKQNISKND